MPTYTHVRYLTNSWCIGGSRSSCWCSRAHEMLHLQLLELIQLDEKNRLALIEFAERERVAEQVTLE